MTMNEVRLIDANALRLALDNDHKLSVYLDDLIDNTPTIWINDVNSVVHAKWEWKDFNYDGIYTLCCSNCLESEGVREDHKYCHTCGATMDLE